MNPMQNHCDEVRGQRSAMPDNGELTSVWVDEICSCGRIRELLVPLLMIHGNQYSIADRIHKGYIPRNGCQKCGDKELMFPEDALLEWPRSADTIKYLMSRGNQYRWKIRHKNPTQA